MRETARELRGGEAFAVSPRRARRSRAPPHAGTLIAFGATMNLTTALNERPERTAIVVDDDPATQRLMLGALEGMKMRARGFADAETALAFLLETQEIPDVIAIDLQLPRMSGLELGRRIRENGRLKTVPLVLTTSRESLQDEEAAAELRAEFLPKPFHVRDYLVALQSALTTAGARPLVLVVDDDAGIREALASILTEEGFEIVSAVDGCDALIFLEQQKLRPALIVLDLMMPAMDGVDLAYRLRADDALAAIPILLFSANQHVATVANDVGAIGHLKKPVDLEELVDTISVAVGKTS